MTEPKDEIAADGTEPADAAARAPLDRPSSGVAKGSSRKSSPNDVGSALRNAFRATVDEEIPNEMLDLLRRLD